MAPTPLDNSAKYFFYGFRHTDLHQIDAKDFLVGEQTVQPAQILGSIAQSVILHIGVCFLQKRIRAGSECIAGVVHAH